MFERSSRSHSATCTGVGMVDKPVSGTGAQVIFGSGYLISEQKKQEKEKAEREKAEREKAERWELSQREMDIIKSLG